MSLWYMKRRLEAEKNQGVVEKTTPIDLPKVEAKVEEQEIVKEDKPKRGRPSKK